MNKYEGIFILKDKTKENKINEIIEELTADVENIQKIEKVGVKDLAYTIKRHKKGYFIIIYFETTEAGRAEIETIARNNENILKFIIIKGWRF